MNLLIYLFLVISGCACGYRAALEYPDMGLLTIAICVAIAHIPLLLVLGGVRYFLWRGRWLS